MLNIPIVVSAFNREIALERLLSSLSVAKYSVSVKLIISIDGGGSTNVIKIASQFEWPHGEKELIVHEGRLGLRKHILFCGSLTKQYDGIILFEDDLYAAPYFYDYIQQTQPKYSCDPSIAGVALYSHQFNETAYLPFTPMSDGYDVFFMQLACSWGQCWMKSQWGEFEQWYKSNSHKNLKHDTRLPPDLLLWPETSWKKYFIKYMVDKKKYFVYPRVSLVTNFGDKGEHHKGTNTYQVSMIYTNKEYFLPLFSDSFAKYDAYCEISQNSLKHYNTELMKYDFEVDLYGMKRKNNITTDYIITTQKLEQAMTSYGRELKPHEMNIIENITGDLICLGKTVDMSAYGPFLTHRNAIFTNYRLAHSYFFSTKAEHYNFNIPVSLLSKDIRVLFLKLLVSIHELTIKRLLNLIRIVKNQYIQ